MVIELEKAYNSLEKYNYIQKVELYLDGEPTKEFYQYDLKVLKDGFSYKNAVLDLNVRLYPNNGSYKSVTWESSNELISVTEDGNAPQPRMILLRFNYLARLKIISVINIKILFGYRMHLTGNGSCCFTGNYFRRNRFNLSAFQNHKA